MNNIYDKKEKPIISLSIYLTASSLSIDAEQITLLNAMADEQNADEISRLQETVREAYQKITAQFKKILENHFDDVWSANSTALSESTFFFIEGGDDIAE